MARLNPRRRRLAAQTRLFNEIVSAHGRANDDSYLLQRGAVASSVDKFTRVGAPNANQVRMRPPIDRTSAPAWYRGDDGRMVYQGDK